MDALPMQEDNTFAHRSRYDGRMHGCGHDGHTTMLLAAARYLAETRAFDGTVTLIFQPGEEGYAGGKAMIEDGLFERFPADQVCAAQLARPPGRKIAVRPGPMMAAGPDHDRHRGQGRPWSAPAPGRRPGAGGRPHHHRGAVDRGAQRLADRHGGREPVRDARRPSGRDERDPAHRAARRDRAHVPDRDAGPDREAPPRARDVDRVGLRRVGEARLRARLSGDDQFDA
jgi:hypothetical protein